MRWFEAERTKMTVLGMGQWGAMLQFALVSSFHFIANGNQDMICHSITVELPTVFMA